MSDEESQSLENLFGAGSDVEEPAQIASIASAWQHPLVQKISNRVDTEDGGSKTVRSWKCLCCQKVFSGWNATKALGHGSKDDVYCLQVHASKCMSVMSDYHTGLFRDLLQRKSTLKIAKEKAVGAVLLDIDESQEQIVHAVKKRKGASMERSLGFARFVAALFQFYFINRN